MEKKAESTQKKKQTSLIEKEEQDEKHWALGSKVKNTDEIEKKQQKLKEKQLREELLSKEEEKFSLKKPTLKINKTALKRELKSDSFLKNEGFTEEYRASNLEDALNLLEITTGATNTKIDKHPEKRVKSAFAEFEV